MDAHAFWHSCAQSPMLLVLVLSVLADVVELELAVAVDVVAGAVDVVVVGAALDEVTTRSEQSKGIASEHVGSPG